jgi:methylamine dehydrogenase light chain
MDWFDSFTERSARGLARSTSRRSLITRLGWILTGAAALPLLPVARGAAPPAAVTGVPSDDPSDPLSCDYWRNCAIDGFLCGCCGGDHRTCPPGTVPSVLAWLGTCRNPGDGRDYVISYRDCCGKSSCGRCFCDRRQDEKPTYVPPKSSDIDWCAGSPAGLAVNCSLTVVAGVVDAG